MRQQYFVLISIHFQLLQFANNPSFYIQSVFFLVHFFPVIQLFSFLMDGCIPSFQMNAITLLSDNNTSLDLKSIH